MSQNSLLAALAIGVAVILGGTQARAAPDLVIRNVTVTDVRKSQFLTKQDILVQGGRIIAIVPTRPTGPTPAAAREIDGTNLVALPGFVNTHTHLWQHVARSIAPTSSLQQWAGLVYRSAHYADGADVRALTDAAAGEALLGGTTTLVDFASINFREDATPAVLAALKDNNIDGGVVWWRQAAFLPPALHERQLAALSAAAGPKHRIFMGFGPLSFMSLPSVYDGVITGRRMGLPLTEHEMENLAEARDFQKKLADYWAETGGGEALSAHDQRLLGAIVSRPPLSASNGYLEMARRAAWLRANTVPNQPLTPVEQQALGALADFDPPRPFALLEDWGALDGFLSIHSVWPTAADVALLAKHRAAVSHNPESNMYLSSGVSPILAYAKAGVPVTLGTDGAASNDRISMFDALRTAALLQKVGTLSAETTAGLDAWFWLRAATLNGAEAAGLGASAGSLERGKDADILLVDRRSLGATPMLAERNMADMLVNSVSGRDLAFVIANGVVMAEGGRLKDEAARAARLQAAAERMWRGAENGAPWRETMALRPEMGGKGWWRYRSVRPKDTIDLHLRNEGGSPLRLVLAFSGSTFGGQTAPALSAEALTRYPLKPPAGYRAWTVELLPGQGVAVRRGAGEPDYVIDLPSGSVRRKSVNSEQLLLYVADGVTMP
ncbi:hypothetical protein DDF62_02590 [Caulobacter radicis]|uniref:amidohydrolase family protein n=1 Tax=Caulobacter radicis TaxID=2172650 RepID=UPI000D582D7F|nr:amidohydrolase family protein [Caulobacter radicis]PVM92061.1 hypothetical protein DDF62_02590 [Caulobacter radicis]